MEVMNEAQRLLKLFLEKTTHSSANSDETSLRFIAELSRTFLIGSLHLCDRFPAAQELESSLAVTKQEIKWAFESLFSMYSNDIVKFFRNRSASNKYVAIMEVMDEAQRVLKLFLDQDSSANSNETSLRFIAEVSRQFIIGSRNLCHRFPGARLESSPAVTKQEIKWAFENVVSVYSNNIVNYFFSFETAPKQYLFDAIGESCAENVVSFMQPVECSRLYSVSKLFKKLCKNQTWKTLELLECFGGETGINGFEKYPNGPRYRLESDGFMWPVCEIWRNDSSVLVEHVSDLSLALCCSLHCADLMERSLEFPLLKSLHLTMGPDHCYDRKDVHAWLGRFYERQRSHLRYISVVGLSASEIDQVMNAFTDVKNLDHIKLEFEKDCPEIFQIFSCTVPSSVQEFELFGNSDIVFTSSVISWSQFTVLSLHAVIFDQQEWSRFCLGICNVKELELVGFDLCLSWHDDEVEESFRVTLKDFVSNSFALGLEKLTLSVGDYWCCSTELSSETILFPVLKSLVLQGSEVSLELCQRFAINSPLLQEFRVLKNLEFSQNVASGIIEVFGACKNLEFLMININDSKHHYNMREFEGRLQLMDVLCRNFPRLNDIELVKDFFLYSPVLRCFKQLATCYSRFRT